MVQHNENCLFVFTVTSANPHDPADVAVDMCISRTLTSISHPGLKCFCVSMCVVKDKCQKPNVLL